MKLFSTAKKHLEFIHSYQPGKPIEEVQRQYGVRNAIKMASNENPLGPSPRAVEAARKALTRAHRYPDGGCHYLRNKLAARLHVKPEELVFGNGSDELLVFAARAFLRPGDEAVIADPTFLIYEIASQTEGAKCVKVPMKDFRYDLPAMARAVTGKTRVVFIANPDNPVGTYVTERELTAFMQKCPSNVVVVLDEAYYEFARQFPGYPDAFKLYKRYPNLMLTRTFSKAYGLSGLRIGYAVADSVLAATLNKLREPFNVNLIAQEAALAALDDRKHLERSLRVVRDGRLFLQSELRKMGYRIVETVTNFILVDLKKDSRAIHERLLRKGIIVRPMGVWGLKTFLRVTIGTKAENQKFIKALKSIGERS